MLCNSRIICNSFNNEREKEISQYRNQSSVFISRHCPIINGSIKKLLIVIFALGSTGQDSSTWYRRANGQYVGETNAWSLSLSFRTTWINMSAIRTHTFSHACRVACACVGSVCGALCNLLLAHQTHPRKVSVAIPRRRIKQLRAQYSNGRSHRWIFDEWFREKAARRLSNDFQAYGWNTRTWYFLYNHVATCHYIFYRQYRQKSD